MARHKRGAKSQFVRDFIAANPNAGPKDIRDGLKVQGVKVSASLVSAVKYGKGRSRNVKRPSVPAAARRTSAGTVTIEQLIEVKRFADGLGGAANVRQALDTLEQLR